MHDVSAETFIELVIQRDVEGIQTALRQGHYDIDTPDHDGKTALHHAVQFVSIDRDLTVVRLLVDLGADVNLKDQTNCAETALHAALRLRLFDAAKMILESPSFDILQSDSRHPMTMLPEICAIEPVRLSHADAVNCTSMQSSCGDRSTSAETETLQEGYDAIFVHRNASEYITRHRRPLDQPALPVRHLVVVRHPPTTFGQLLTGLEMRNMTSLCLVDCPIEPEMLSDDIFNGLMLRTLVLSGTGIRRIPSAVLRLSSTSLETLKIDRNRLGPEIAAESVSHLSFLRTFICDAQRPRLRRLQRNLLCRFSRLEVLSFADNRISDDLDWIADVAPRLRVLNCRRNRLRRFPAGLDTLEQLDVVDLSHNRIDELPAETVRSLNSRLTRFDLFNAGLFRRCAYLPLKYCDNDGLSANLDLDVLMLTPPPRPPPPCHQDGNSSRSTTTSNTDRTFSARSAISINNQADRDVTILVVGESRAGKRSLIEAMAAAVASSAGSASSSSTDRRGFRRHQSPSSAAGTGCLSSLDFDIREQCGGTCHVTALAVSGDDLTDEFVRQIRADLVLLTFDLQCATTEPPQQTNGTRIPSPTFHRKRRWIARLQMWLQALYELDPDTAVLLVGTHADLADGGGELADTWRRLSDGLLDLARPHHIRRNAELHRRSTTHCLLCSPKYLAVRLTASVSTSSLPTAVSNCISTSGNNVSTSGGCSTASSASGSGSNSSDTRSSSRRRDANTTSAQRSPVPRRNFTGFVDLSLPVGTNGAAGTGSTNGHVTSGSGKPTPVLRFPHIVGYYETELGSGSMSQTSTRKSGVAFADVPSYVKVTTTISDYEPLIRTTTTTTASSSGYSSGSTAGRTSDSITRLLAAILRLTEARQSNSKRPPQTNEWSALGRRLAMTFGQRMFPVASLDEIANVASSCDRAGHFRSDSSLPAALLYLHRRGRIIYAPGGNERALSRLVCVSPPWFLRIVRRVISSLGRSCVCRAELIQCLKRELERPPEPWSMSSMDETTTVGGGSTRPQRLSLSFSYPSASNYSAAAVVADELVCWFLEAMLRFGTCFPVPPSSSLSYSSNYSSDRSDDIGPLFVFPSLLEIGNPTADVWPDYPGPEERQITCEFRLRSLRPGFFTDIVRRLSSLTTTSANNGSVDSGFMFRCRELRRVELSLAEAVRVPFQLLADNITFGVRVNLAGCEDCYVPFSNHPDFGRETNCEVVNAHIQSAPSSIVLINIRLNPDLEVVRVQCRGVSVGLCCAMRYILDFLDLYLDDAPSDDRPPQQSAVDLTSKSLQDDDSISDSPLPSYSQSNDDIQAASNGLLADPQPPPELDEDFDDDERLYFLLCPKCVLFRIHNPDRIRVLYRTSGLRHPTSGLHNRKPVCRRWHHLGSWYRAIVGDYRKLSPGSPPSCNGSSAATQNGQPATAASAQVLPDYEHPHLIMLAPAGIAEAVRDWYLFSRAAFLDGSFDVHLLCENPAYWHFVDGSTYRVVQANVDRRSGRSQSLTAAANSSSSSTTYDYATLYGSPRQSSPRRTVPDGRSSSTLPAQLVNLAVAVVQAVTCVQAARTVAPVIDRLSRTHADLLAVFDDSDDEAPPSSNSSNSTAATEPIELPEVPGQSMKMRTRDRVATMLAVVVSGAIGGSQADVIRRVGSLFQLPASSIGVDPTMIADSIVFRSMAKSGSRREMARLLRAHESPSGRRFGQLRAVFVGHEIRWVCDRHFEELKGPQFCCSNDGSPDIGSRLKPGAKR